MARGNPSPPPGTPCSRTARPPKKNEPPVPPLPPHPVVKPEDDVDLQKVLAWLNAKSDLIQLMTGAVVGAIDYILDGARTGRFDLQDPEVDSDERSAVGVHVQYRVLEALELPKIKPLDTVIADVAVDIKNTVGDGWMIPKEAQCELCILIQIDAANDRFAVRLMRTHEIMLNPGGNQDSKRGIIKAAQNEYAVPLFPNLWEPLPHNPLRDLTPDQRDVVFAPKVGMVTRTTALFGFLPNTIFPRHTLLTVGARMKDPLRRVREARRQVLEQHGLTVLCGTWADQKAVAKDAGYDLEGEAWVAIPFDPSHRQIATLSRVIPV